MAIFGMLHQGFGDVHDVITEMEKIVSLCAQGQIEEARALAETTKRNIAMSRDLSDRPYIPLRLREVMDIVDRAERKGALL